MGNTHSWDTIRKNTIKSRDQKLVNYKHRFEQIIQDHHLTNQKIHSILQSDLVGLVNLLNQQQVKSLALVAIYGLRAIQNQKLYNFMTVDHFQFAIQKAIQCDEYRLSSGKRNWTINDSQDSQKYLPPLFGIPVSIKDNIDLKNSLSTLGLTIRANNIIKQDCGIVTCIKNSGMIPFIKTNLLQMAMSFETNNFLWGRTLNPWNIKKSSGGSSGGQGVAVSTRSSPIGIGNDIGGSVRIPSHFCGVCGLLPTIGRLPLIDSLTQYSTSFNGKDGIKSNTGPLGTSIDSLALWMKVVTTQQYYKQKNDPYVKLFKFDCKLYDSVFKSKQKLRIGFYQNLKTVQCSPACKRALNLSVDYLKSCGHQIIQIQIPNQEQIILSFIQEFFSQGQMQVYKDMLQGEKFAPQYQLNKLTTSLWPTIFKPINWLTMRIFPRMGKLMSGLKKLSTYEYCKLEGRRIQLRKQWTDYWKNKKLDFVICPAFATEAINHELSNKAGIISAYTFIYNTLSMPACIVPVTTVRQNEQSYESRYNDPITSAIKQNAKDSIGLPVGVQIVGMPFQEERILGLAKKLQQHFKFNQNYKYPNN